MTCDDIRPRLTAYLDGELEGDRGTVVRGHLRTCEACRQVATDEAALRDGLRALPTVDPPPAMWAAIQAQLAAAEVAEANRPAWKRTLARWTPQWPRLAIGGMALAAAASLLWMRAQRADEAARPPTVAAHPSPEIRPSIETPRPVPPVIAPSADDVTAELAAEPARVTETYAQTAAELLALADEERARWSAAQRAAFDARLGVLRAAVDAATEGRPRQRAWRAIIRYVQGAVIRDDVALASGGTP